IGKLEWRSHPMDFRLLERRLLWTILSSSGYLAATLAFAASLPPTTPRLASRSGGSIPFPGQANLAMRRGRTKLGKAVAVQLGLREVMTRRLIFFTGESVIPPHLSPAMYAPATTFLPTALLHCMRVPGSLLGISNLHPTTNMTGIQAKRQYLLFYL